jgi:hypothetical protein
VKSLIFNEHWKHLFVLRGNGVPNKPNFLKPSRSVFPYVTLGLFYSLGAHPRAKLRINGPPLRYIAVSILISIC